MKRIRRVLIANRGEVAVRVIRTLRELGITSIAVFSAPDRASLHVLLADEAYPIGPGPARESYLNLERVLQTALDVKADAIHPGYGFFAESAPFARACEQAGVVFIGPRSDIIAALGDKLAARAAARKAGVPLVPGSEAPLETIAELRAAAKKLGLPLMLKAAAGGGGKGLRLVKSAADLVSAAQRARSEARSAFGDDRVYLEKALVQPRHVEIQVVADRHGNAVHLFERECSIQRRHQKVVEEAPSTAVTQELRDRMGAAAVGLAAALSYVGAGTVEYLLDETPDGGGMLVDGGAGFFFLEMNTRLQVEHPVTEEVTGYDLVRLQLEVAMGRPLGLRQDQIAPRGHAVEVRLYAEDPSRGFAPTFGLMHRYDHDELPGVRYEDGVTAGAGSGIELSPFYDPMLAKVVAHATTRAEAAGRLRRALAGMRLHGPRTNRDFLVALLGEADFLAGRTRTDYVDHHPGLLAPALVTPAPVHLAAAVAVSVHRRRTAAPVAGFAPPGWRLRTLRPAGQEAEWARVDGDHDPIPVRYRLAGTMLELTVDGHSHELRLRGLGADGVTVELDGVERHCSVHLAPDGTAWVNDRDTQTGWRELPRLPAADTDTAAGGPVSDVPGTVTAVLVAPGDRVGAGETLVVLEAMKMEHRAVAAADGVVEDVRVRVGQYVDAHEVLVTLAPLENPPENPPEVPPENPPEDSPREGA